MQPTERQREVLRLVHAGGTLRSIGRALGIRSTNGVDEHIWRSVRKGLIEETKDAACPNRYALTDAGLAEIGLKRCSCCKGEGTVPWTEK